ncbi:hypothetical protein V1522DRAFT_395799 [Lipomyces starkeyi]
MKPFGCSAHVLISNAHRDHKWAGKSFAGIMVGYSTQSKAYRILQLHSKEIVIARNVKFDESVFPGLSKEEPNNFDVELESDMLESDSNEATQFSASGALELGESDVVEHPRPGTSTPAGEPMNVDPTGPSHSTNSEQPRISRTASPTGSSHTSNYHHDDPTQSLPITRYRQPTFRTNSDSNQLTLYDGNDPTDDMHDTIILAPQYLYPDRPQPYRKPVNAVPSN